MPFGTIVDAGGTLVLITHDRNVAMDPTLENKILELLDRHRVMTLATLRPDGWPQATTVGYVNDGLNLYFLCGLDSQKAANLARDDRVSLTIDDDPAQIMQIAGLSMAAHAERVSDRREAEKVLSMLPAQISRSGVLSAVDAQAGGGRDLSFDADGDLRSRLYEGLRPHGARDLLTGWRLSASAQAGPCAHRAVNGKYEPT